MARRQINADSSSAHRGLLFCSLSLYPYLVTLSCVCFSCPSGRGRRIWENRVARWRKAHHTSVHSHNSHQRPQVPSIRTLCPSLGSLPAALTVARPKMGLGERTSTVSKRARAEEARTPGANQHRPQIGLDPASPPPPPCQQQRLFFETIQQIPSILPR